MSISIGYVLDLLELISKYGSYGLRFGLMLIALSGQDIRFDERQFEEGRNFATKLWNAARFRLSCAWPMHLPKTSSIPKLGREVTAFFDLFFIETNILTARRNANETKSQAVRTVLANQFKRIRRIAQ